MAFDSGVTTEAWTIVIAVWSHPIFPILMVIFAWIAYARRKTHLPPFYRACPLRRRSLLYIEDICAQHVLVRNALSKIFTLQGFEMSTFRKSLFCARLAKQLPITNYLFLKIWKSSKPT
jgi:hypothetical protein